MTAVFQQTSPDVLEPAEQAREDVDGQVGEEGGAALLEGPGVRNWQ